MSEGSWFPKAPQEAVKYIIWFVLILGFGLDAVNSFVHRDWTSCIIASAGLVILTSAALFWTRLWVRLDTLNAGWIVFACGATIIALALSPFIEQQRWPFGGLISQSVVSPAPAIGTTKEQVVQQIADATRDLTKELEDAKAKIAVMAKADRSSDGYNGLDLHLSSDNRSALMTLDGERKAVCDQLRKTQDEIDPLLRNIRDSGITVLTSLGKQKQLAQLDTIGDALNGFENRFAPYHSLEDWKELSTIFGDYGDTLSAMAGGIWNYKQAIEDAGNPMSPQDIGNAAMAIKRPQIDIPPFENWLNGALNRCVEMRSHIQSAMDHASN